MAAIPTRGASPPRWELDAYRLVNQLPDALHGPLWTVMQAGALGAAPAAAAVALAAGDRPLATRLLTGGTVAWAAAKLVKWGVPRGRPSALAVVGRTRGRAATGGGFPSGHAAVATALAAAAFPSLPRQVRPLAVSVALTVALARMYVGAHLPLDVLGGAALGLVVDGALSGR